jgi:hypothetical protein
VEQEKFLAHMNKEIVDDEDVKKGFIDSHFILDDSKQGTGKRRQVDGQCC